MAKKAKDKVGSFNFGANVKPKKSKTARKGLSTGRRSSQWSQYVGGK